MTSTLSHRGPDDHGNWCDETSGLALGQRRLSIIDLSHQGHQPMVSHDDRYVLVLNGEIYNHGDLRKDLQKQGFQFKGTSDTEVAVCAIQQWGFKDALVKFVGMFALAVWDREQRSLVLARDRLGEKPLYYGRLGNATFAFASELKALRAHPHWRGEINRDALGQLMKYTYIPSPLSIYTGILKLPPGTYMEYGGPNDSTAPMAYWSMDDVVLGGSERRDQGRDPAAAAEELEALLTGTIRDKMVADVPLGAFLSGGIDSSLIVALMQAQSSRPVKTFSIGFHESEYNEAEHARRVASHLGTDHTELYVTPEDSLAVIPRLPQLYDEPFSDSSQIPTFLVSQLARREVTVALSGDGGDELFGGYSRYLVGLDAWQKLRKIPGFIRYAGKRLIPYIPPRYIDRAVRPVMPLLPASFRYAQFGQKLHKLASTWDLQSADAIYSRLVSLWTDPGKLVIGSHPVDVLGSHQHTLDGLDDFTERMMFTDTVTYLPDDILVKVDRASMAVSLEVRVPFLDHRVVEYIWNQPSNLKIVGNEGKWLLRQVLYKYVPKNLIDRPKMGFGVPIDHWLRGPLREWAAELISSERLKREGFLEPGPVKEKWLAHSSGDASWHYHLWPVLMFQAWHEHWHQSAG